MKPISRFKIAFENEGEVQNPAEDQPEALVDMTPVEVDTELAAEAEPAPEVAEDGTAVEAPVELEAVSNPEDVLAIEELTEEVTGEVAENDHVEEVASGLEDLATIAGQIDEPTPVENALIQTAANMAVAGTDTDADAVIPAIESFKDKKLAVEQLTQKVQVARESILDSAKTIYGKIKDLIKKIFVFTYRMESKVKEAKELLVEAKKSKVKEVTVKVRASRFFMKDAKTQVADADDYLKSLSESVKVFDKFSSAAVKSVIDFNGSVGEWFKTFFDKKGTTEASVRLYDAFVGDFVSKAAKLPGLEKTASKDGVETYTSGKLLGSYGFTVSVPLNIPKLKVQDDKILNSDEARVSVRQAGVRFSRTALMPVGDVKSSIEFTFDAKKIEQLITASEAALQVFKKFLNESYKSFSNQALYVEGSKVNTPITPLHTTLVNSGINNAITVATYAKSYSANLTSGPLGLAMTALKSSKWKAAE